MLKWDEFVEEEKSSPLPPVYTWLTIAIYATAFLSVTFLWLHWLIFLTRYHQTLILMLY